MKTTSLIYFSLFAWATFATPSLSCSGKEILPNGSGSESCWSLDVSQGNYFVSFSLPTLNQILSRQDTPRDDLTNVNLERLATKLAPGQLARISYPSRNKDCTFVIPGGTTVEISPSDKCEQVKSILLLETAILMDEIATASLKSRGNQNLVSTQHTSLFLAADGTAALPENIESFAKDFAFSGNTISPIDDTLTTAAFLEKLSEPKNFYIQAKYDDVTKTITISLEGDGGKVLSSTEIETKDGVISTEPLGVGFELLFTSSLPSYPADRTEYLHHTSYPEKTFFRAFDNGESTRIDSISYEEAIAMVSKASTQWKDIETAISFLEKLGTQ